MATEAKVVRFKKQLKQWEAHKKDPTKVKFTPRQRIRVRLRC